MKNWDNVRNNANIDKLVFGMKRINERWETGVCFDIKKLKNLKEESKYYGLWNDVLYVNDGTALSTQEWNAEYSQIEESIPNGKQQ